MALTNGDRLGPYEVLGPLGAGGMGEVWRALDTRLGREVAVKVLPDTFATDPGRLARFDREARLLASLSHPAIATVHGFEQADGVSLLVLELVEGPTLAERLRRRPLPVREALRAAVQIAEALEAAHEKGIVHRDLKPANVKVLPEGRIKLLDFGLAKALDTGRPAAEVAALATETSPTEAGVILGTASYMSPEQARGLAVDARTDVWSFGCLLYEMLTVGRGFPGATGSDVTAAILEREPRWELLPAEAPYLVRSVLRRCLEKDVARRLRHIADARLEIEEALAAPEAVVARPPHRARAVMALAALALVGAVTVGFWLGARRTSTTWHGPTRLNIEVEASARLPSQGFQPQIALSPDGTRLVYDSTKGFYLRSLDTLEARLIPGTERASYPFFSPDGRWIGYQSGGKLQRVSVDGGTPLTITGVGALRGASWCDDGTIVYTPDAASGLWRASVDGGAPQKLTEPDRTSETSHRWPQLLPDGRTVLFTAYAPSGRGDESRIDVISLESGRRKTILRGGTYGRYVPTGHVIYASGGTIFAAPFDAGALAVSGPPAAVLQDVRMLDATGVAQVAFAPTGAAVYVAPYFRPPPSRLWRVDRRGAATPVPGTHPALAGLSLSPDGQRLIARVNQANGESLWLHDFRRQTWTALTFEKNSAYPVWSPSG